MKDSNNNESFQSDSLQRFIFDNAEIRGEWVHLTSAWQAVTSRRHYPQPIQRALGEMMAAAALLAATVKIDGRLVLQVKSQGSVNLMMVECTSDNTLRAFAQWDQEATLADDASLYDLTGSGTLAISIEVTAAAQPYQGIVSLNDTSVAALLENYFKQSEQLSTRVWLSADKEVAGGLLLQQLPNPDKSSEEEAESWSRISQLASTVSQNELMTLGPGTLLHRLFHEEECRLLATTKMRFACSCSRERVANTINLLGHQDAMDLVQEQEKIEVACEFCNEHYYFDKADVALIFAHAGASTIFDSDTLH
ncbi:MAG: molecular chaperone Hsp33 [Methylophagaceae bacterium]|jgi:molecular chaperone Hsp33